MLYDPAPLSLHEFEATVAPDMGVDGASAGTDTAPPEPVGAEASVGAAPTSEPAVPTEALEAPAAAEAPGWSPSQEEWQQTQEALAVMAQLFPQAAPHLFQQPEPEAIELDPFADDFGAQVQSLIEQKAAEIAQAQVAPMVPFVESQIEEQGQKMARDLLGSFSDLGTFDQDMALQVAAGLHQPGGDPARALREAAQQVSQYEQRLKQQGVQEWQAAMQQATQAPQVPSAGLSVVEGGADSIEDAKRRVIERHRG